jgi:hypothetical protein
LKHNEGGAVMVLSYDRRGLPKEEWEDDKNFRWVVLVLFVALWVACIFLFTSCSSRKVEVPAEPGAVDISNSLGKCYIHKDYVSCTLSSGYTYYATMEKIINVTSWDKTMWKDGDNKNVSNIP